MCSPGCHAEHGILHIIRKREKTPIVDESVTEEESNALPFLYVGMFLFLKRKKKIKEVIFHLACNESVEVKKLWWPFKMIAK